MSYALRNKVVIAIAAFMALFGWLALGTSDNPLNMRQTSSGSELQDPAEAPELDIAEVDVVDADEDAEVDVVDADED